MKLKTLFFCCLISIFVFSQNREDVEVGPNYQLFISEIDSCIADKNRTCSEMINPIINKGKKEKVPFLDFLYFKNAYYFMKRNELDSAMKYSQLAIDNPNPAEKFRSDLDAYNILANANYYKRNLNEAIQNYLKVAKILENGGNQLHLGYLYSNIATLLGESGNDDKQIEYLSKSFKLLEENKGEKFIATVASNLALGFYHKKDTTQVENWAKKSLELAEKSNDLVAKTQSNLALSFIQKDWKKALKFAEISVKNAEELGDSFSLASSYYRYAEVLDKLGRKEEALHFAEKSVEFSKEIGDNITLMKAAYTAGIINYNHGLKEKASDYFYQFAILKDSIVASENSKVINELNTKYETEKNKKQIAEQDLKIQKQKANLLYSILGGLLGISILGGIFLYNRKKQKLKLQKLQQEKENAILNSFIQGEERERNRISHELHDGVAAMLGAAKMSLETIPHLPEEKQKIQIEKVAQILENTHADVRHIAHNLLPTVLEKEGIISATKHFAAEINATNLLKISVKDENSEAQSLSNQLQLMLFRIIQELINNIIKHSQAQNASIIFSKNSAGLQIEVSDDGIGFDGEIETENQGLYSISQRMKTIGGNFKIIRKKDKGMRALAEVNLS